MLGAHSLSLALARKGQRAGCFFGSAGVEVATKGGAMPNKAEFDRERREAPEAVARQEAALVAPLRDLATRLVRDPPAVVVTCARGSSAHAATFAKHLIERHLAIPVAAAAPVVATAYRRDLALAGQFFLAISQSGRSDDLIEAALSAKRAGALTAALVNDAESPLAAACDIVLPAGAGPERAVAATKSFVVTLSALLRLTAMWGRDGALRDALARLPERIDKAGRLDWRGAVEAFVPARSLVAIGRGPTLAIAREAALKLKEVANLHAEAFSGAEFLHGPVALVGRDYPLLMFVADDETAAGLRRLAGDLRAKGALLLCADPGDDGAAALPVLPSDHPDADALCLIQSFYAMAPRLAAARGVDADHPRHLQKVTRTR
jgi:glucosamine--fructose-6-phosphate aminotransferase (isomerizing)